MQEENYVKEKYFDGWWS